MSPAGSNSIDACLLMCTDCPAGKYSNNVSSLVGGACVFCPVFSFSVVGSQSLEDCVCNSGYTGLHDGICKGCGPGSFKPVNGSSSCLTCQIGKVSSILAAITEDVCIYCDQNTYPAPDQSKCLECPRNSVSRHRSLDVGGCVCLAGYRGKLCEIKDLGLPGPAARNFLIKFDIAVSLTFNVPNSEFEVASMNLTVFVATQESQLADFFNITDDQVLIAQSDLSVSRRNERRVDLPVSVQVFGEPEQISPTTLQASLQTYLGFSVTKLAATCGQGYSRAEANGPCTPCPSGFFKSQLEDSACTACPLAHMTTTPAAKAQEECTCDELAGYFLQSINNTSDNATENLGNASAAVGRWLCRRPPQFITIVEAQAAAETITTMVTSIIVANVVATVCTTVASAVASSVGGAVSGTIGGAMSGGTGAMSGGAGASGSTGEVVESSTSAGSAGSAILLIGHVQFLNIVGQVGGSNGSKPLAAFSAGEHTHTHTHMKTHTCSHTYTHIRLHIYIYTHRHRQASR